MFYPRLRCYGWSIGTRHLPCTKRSFASSIYPYYSPILVARLHGARPSPTRAASTSASRGGIDGRNHKCSHRSYATIVPSAESPKMKLTEADVKRLSRQRNIGVSAHIDSGKTTLTERILFYTGKIREIHEVRGRDQVGAKMDSMELEREKGITIQSAATFCDWDASLPVGFDASPYASPEDISSESAKDAVKKETYAINIIDTPGHVDFTIEVERALRVLDGAILVLCAVSGVQSQTTTVDRQMKRYNVPRISFINKMDRPGANPNRIIQQIRNKLRLSAAAVQVQIGVEDEFRGVVDLVRWKAITFSGDNGMTVTEEAIPDALLPVATEKRQELIATLADLDSEIADLFLEDKEPNTPQLTAAIRRQTLSGKFTPVFLGSAIKNTGVQALLDGVCAYLPGPAEKDVFAHDNTPRSTSFPEAEAENQSAEQEVITSTSQQSAPQVSLTPASAAPLVALAFKLEEGRFGQLTYMRVYQGSMRKGSVIFNARTGKKVKVPRLVRMHSDELEDIEEIGPGEICAIFGVECASGDTFTDGSTNLSMTSMYVPEPVISLSLKPTGQETPNFSRALNRFQKEDPTFKVHIDPESKETIISGMGELHLQIYVERMKREYNVECVTGKPQVAYRETPTQKVEFSFTHKKQTGGAGQFAKISGYYEPLLQPDGTVEEGSIRRAGDVKDVEFENIVMGGNIPAGYIPAIELGFQDALKKGSLCGGPVTNIRFVLRDGQAHSVDSSELAFKICSIGAFRENYAKMRPVILEPIMNVEVVAPVEFQSNVIGGITARRGTIVDNEVRDDDFTLSAEVPLNDMFGYSSQLRGSTQGKGEFSMEYKNHMPVLPNAQKELEEAYRRTRPQAKK